MSLCRPGIEPDAVPSSSGSTMSSAQLEEELVSLQKGAEAALHMTSPESRQTEVGVCYKGDFCRIISTSRTRRICMTLSKSSSGFIYKACVPSNLQANVPLQYRSQVQIIEYLQRIAANQVVHIQHTVDKRVCTLDPITTTIGRAH